MRMRLLLLMVLVAACRPQPAASGAETGDSISPRDAGGGSGIAAFFDAGPVKLASSRAGIEAQLGAPDSTRTEAVPNRHDAAVADSLFTLHYDGLVVSIRRAGYDGKELIAQLAISDDRHLEPDSPLRVGDAADAVRALLGAPDSESPSQLHYACDDCLVAGHEAVTFFLERGRVRRIELTCWID